MRRKILLAVLLIVLVLVMAAGRCEAPELREVSPTWVPPATATTEPTPEPTPAPTPVPNPTGTPVPLTESLELQAQRSAPERPWMYDNELTPERNIYIYLTEEAGLSRAAACGILGNMAYETGETFEPTASNAHSYGLCQWLGVRLDRLLSWCDDNGEDHTTIEGQLKFLVWEMQEDDPYGTWEHLLSVEDSENGAYSAGWYFCYWFERPLDLANQARWRGYKAMEYFEEMGNAA